MSAQAQWPSLPEIDARLAAEDTPAADMEFELEFFKPIELRSHPKYRERCAHMLDAPGTTTYCVATANTRKGPFVCIMPLDGRIALRTPDLTKTLIAEAQKELTRAWAT
ncbi:MAG TPA: hypothetical protein VK756_07685 [Solirubrobacteraceae bacterium]|nr:hypothetical protein [Solirubrobacteraceae bacterium]